MSGWSSEAIIINIQKLCLVWGISKFVEKSNIVPVHLKEDKQCMVNYRPVSILPICGKKCWKNPVFEFLEKKLLSPNQHDFWPTDFSENQPLSIVHSIYTYFDQSPSFEVKCEHKDCYKNLKLLEFQVNSRK